MAGIFVAYHNTRELFGFEFLPQRDLDECLFGMRGTGAGKAAKAKRNCFARIITSTDHVYVVVAVVVRLERVRRSNLRSVASAVADAVQVPPPNVERVFVNV
jgi:hypothetical protein